MTFEICSDLLCIVHVVGDDVYIIHGDHGDEIKINFLKINPYLNSFVLNSPKLGYYFVYSSRETISRLPFQDMARDDFEK